MCSVPGALDDCHCVGNGEDLVETVGTLQFESWDAGTQRSVALLTKSTYTVFLPRTTRVVTNIKHTVGLAQLNSLQELTLRIPYSNPTPDDLDDWAVHCLCQLSHKSALRSITLLGLGGAEGSMMSVARVAGTASLPALRELRFSGLPLESMQLFPPAMHLEFLDLIGCRQPLQISSGMLSLAGLPDMPCMRALPWARTLMEDLAPVARQTALQALTSRSVLKWSDFSMLPQLQLLCKLVLRSIEVCDVSPISHLHHLSHLDISYSAVTTLGPIAGLTLLCNLQMACSPGIQDLSVLGALCKLERLDIAYNRGLDLTPLRELRSLRFLDISETCGLVNVAAALAALTGLTVLRTSHDFGPGVALGVT